MPALFSGQIMEKPECMLVKYLTHNFCLNQCQWPNLPQNNTLT